MTEIKVSKNIIRNNGYNLRAYDLVTYVKLLLISEKSGSDELLLDHTYLKKLLMIDDNRTFKKTLNNLYEHKLIKEKFDKLPTKAALKVTINKITSDDTTIINNEIFKCFGDFKHIGMHIVFYLMTYIDKGSNDYTKLIEYETISERLMINKDTIMTYMRFIRANKEYSFLTDKKHFEGDKIYKEDQYIPPKRTSHLNRNLELKLEEELIDRINIIEEGMTYIDRQVEIKDGRIDILARDKNNTLCVIELKVVSNEERLIFQCVYYPTQFNEPVRMITIAPDYDYKIKTALNSLNVEMKTYEYKHSNVIIK